MMPEQAEPDICPMIISTVKRPSATCRSCIGARSPIAAIAIGMIPPEATPVTARTTAITSKEVARAATVENSASATRQSRIVRILPIASASGPRKGCPMA